MNAIKYSGGFRKLIAWQEAHALTLQIYNISKQFPATEKFGITSQLQRAASSIGAQIAEGSRMRTYEHRRSYYDRAHGSAAEVDNFLELAHDLTYISDDQYKKLVKDVNRVSALVYGLRNAKTSDF